MNTEETLLERIFNPSTLTRKVIAVLLGSILLAIASQVTVPLKPVPITMQTFAILLIGMTYGSRLGAITMIVYLTEGAAGLPVFAGGTGGYIHLFGPTGGYLWGFILAAFVIGWLAEHGWGKTFITTAAAMLVGNALLYIPGLLVLKGVLSLGWEETLASGLMPFLIGDSLKLLLAAVTMPFAWHIVNKRDDQSSDS